MAIRSQAEQRRPQHMKDQHGRPWFADVEKATGFPTGPVRPMFRVPRKELLPDQKYLVFSTENPGLLTINYDQWIKDVTDAGDEWDRKRIDVAAAIPGGANSPQLAQIMGPRPMKPTPIIAMRQGNSWALGEAPPPGVHGAALNNWKLSTPMPPEARAFFPEPEAPVEQDVFTETVFTDSAPVVETVSPPANLHGAALAAWKRKHAVEA